MTQADAASVKSPVSPWWHWVLLLAGLPLLLTAAVPDWMYSPSESIDSWVYHGFFRHFESYSSTTFRGTYYGSRLGWIVPGYVAYRLFTPFAAALILHLTFYCVAVSSLFVIVRRIAGPSSGLFAAFAFGLYLPATRSLGADYIDGPVIAYALLSVALGIHGIDESKRVWTLGSGMAAGLMLNCNITAGLLFPSILVWFVPERLRGGLPLWVHAVLWPMGIALSTIVLAVISVTTGGKWDFFMDSFRWLRAQGWTNPWDIEGVSWIARSPWVFLPASTLVGALVAWLVPGRRVMSPGQRRAIGALGLGVGVFVVLDVWGDFAPFYFAYYASWLMPWTFAVIGAVLIPALTRVRSDAASLVLCVLVLGVSLVWPQYTRLPVPGFTGLGLTMGLVLVATLARHAVTSRLTVAVAIACLHGWLSTTTYYRSSDDRADAFRAIDRGVGIIDYYVGQTQPRFLLAMPKQLAHYVQGLTSVYLWEYTIVTDRYPTITAEQAARILPGAIVVVIAEYADAAQAFDEVFAPYGLSGQPKGSERVETVHGPLFLTFVEAQARHQSK